MYDSGNDQQEQRGRPSFFKSVFQYRDPKLAWIAFIIAGMALVLCLANIPVAEKFGFLMCIGFGVGYLAAGAKAIMSRYSNLSVLMCLLGAVMVCVSVFSTPEAVFAANSLEDYVPILTSAGMAFFSKVEES